MVILNRWPFPLVPTRRTQKRYRSVIRKSSQQTSLILCWKNQKLRKVGPSGLRDGAQYAVAPGLNR